jgi:predicted transcriptional regulator/nitrous oxidase accessory protein NosD
MRTRRWRNIVGLGLVSLLLIGTVIIPQGARAQPEVDYVIIRDAPNGGGSSVGNRTYITGDQETYYAAGYNNSTGFVEDVDIDWGVGNRNVIDLSIWRGTSTTITAKEYGTTRVSVSDWNMTQTSASTGNLTVISDIDSIVLADAGGGAGKWFGDRLIILLNPLTVYASGYNDTRGYLRDVPVYWSTTNSTPCPVSQFPRKTVSFFTFLEGTCVLSATYSPSVSNSTGLITILSDINSVVIRDAPDGGGSPVGNVSYLPGETDRFYAAGYNTTSGYLRDVWVRWTSTDFNICTVMPSGARYTDASFINAGTCKIIGTFEGIVSNSTGTITVILDIDYLVIRNQSAGAGQPVAGQTLYVGQTYDFYAAGYNTTDGFRRDLPVDWTNSNPTVCDPTLVEEKHYQLEAYVPGVCRLTATYQSVTNDTGDLSVLLDIDELIIRDVANGGGSPVGNRTLYVNVPYFFYAASYNTSTGYLRDLDVTWTSSSNSTCPILDIGIGVQVNPQQPGTCKIIADYRGLVSNMTGLLTVVLDIDFLIIRDSPGGMGSPIEEETYFTGQNARYYAAGYHNMMGYRRDLQVTWLSNNTTVCQIDSDGNVDFWAEGVCNISADFDGWVQNRTGNLHVEWDIDYLVVVDGSGGFGSPVGDRKYILDAADHFIAAGYNHSLGYRRDLKPDWETTNTTVCGMSFYADGHVLFWGKSVGRCKISATYLGRVWNSTGNLTIVSEIDSVIIRDGPGGTGDWVGDGDYIITTEHNFYAAGYNNTSGFVKDLWVYWSTNNTRSCGLTHHTTYVSFKARAYGYCHVKANYHGILFNLTGLLHVIPRPLIIVDDDGGGDYLTIHEAMEEAVDGTTIRVLNGTYHEHVIVNKSVIIEGLDKSNTWVNGSGTGTVFLVTGDHVRITGLTIESAEYGIFIDGAYATLIDENTIRWYDFGIYSNFSKRSHIEENLITEGSNGIVTYHSDNDAIWYNEISYNDNYGAKDYESELSKCFNWNYFHHNKIAYYYDPEEDLNPLLLDSNTFEDNEIAILVEYSSSIYITNNTVLRGDKGISILDGSPFVGNNSIADVIHGIELVGSSSYLLGNTIEDTQNGITAYGESPLLEGNIVRNSEGYALRLEEVEEASLLSNDFGEGEAVISNSSVNQLWIQNGSIQVINCSWEELNVGEGGALEVQWWIQLQILSKDGSPIPDANLKIVDSQQNVIAEFLSDLEGLTPEMAVTQERISESGTLDLNPYTLEVEVDGRKQQFEFIVDSNRLFSLNFIPPVKDQPWLLYVIIALVLVVACLVPPASIERSRYAILAMLTILYSKLKREDALEQFTRGRIYGYIEANPGDHFGAIRKALSLPNGTAVYHLGVLEKLGYVVSKNDGIYKRFYPKGSTLPPDESAQLSEISERILSCIKEAPGIGQKEIASLLGLHQSTLEYQIKVLVKAGLIRLEKVGRRVCYYSAKQSKK